jgi:transcriptional regulator with XRE-family HTH domain
MSVKRDEVNTFMLYLKYWRKRRKMTIDDLAAAAQMSTQTIVRIEKHDHVPTPAVFDKLEKALNVTTQQLYDGPYEKGVQEVKNPNAA